MDSIKKKLKNYIAVAFDKCLDEKIFAELGINISKPNTDYQSIYFDFSKSDVKPVVDFDDNGVFVRMTYPFTAEIKDSKMTLDPFSIYVPVRIKTLYESATLFVQNTINSQPDTYNISQDCNSYNKNGLTNVYLKNSDYGEKELVQFVDFSTYQKEYLHSFIFEFAVKDINIDGFCAG